MSFYLARQVSGNSAHPEYKNKGLNYVAVPVNHLSPLGISLKKQVGFSEYSSHISHFVAATVLGRRVNLTEVGWNIPKEYPNLAFPLVREFLIERTSISESS